MEERTPLIRIAKRDDISSVRSWGIRALSIVFALLLGALIFALVGVNPLEAYSVIFSSTLGRVSGIKQVLRVMTPLLGTGIALAPCFKMHYWNIGGEGQITAGAIGATLVAYNLAGRVPSAPLLLLMAASSALFGAVWSCIPAIFKARWNTNETLFTLMMNYIAIGFAAHLVGGPWEGVPGSQIAPMYDKSAVLPRVFGVHCGWILVLLLTAAMFVYLKYTKHGYEISVLGESENTARYAGMNVPKIIVRTATLSGAICGLVGFMVSSGANQTLYTGCAAGAGFTAIIVAWLANLNPFVMIIISLLLAVLSKGGSSVSTFLGVPTAVSDILSGLILLCMLGSEFFANYRIVFRGKGAER